MLFQELVKVQPASTQNSDIIYDTTNIYIVIWCQQTFVETDASKRLPPPKPEIGVPSKEDNMVVNIGLIRWTAASSGFDKTQAQQRRPTSVVAPGRIFELTNLDIFLKD